MGTTANADVKSARDDIGKLRVDVLDRMCAAIGVEGPEAQAEFFGTDRSVIYRLRNGERRPSLPLAFRMATKLRTQVHVLFVDGLAQ